jgi:hypothetical protein
MKRTFDLWRNWPQSWAGIGTVRNPIKSAKSFDHHTRGKKHSLEYCKLRVDMLVAAFHGPNSERIGHTMLYAPQHDCVDPTIRSATSLEI